MAIDIIDIEQAVDDDLIHTLDCERHFRQTLDGNALASVTITSNTPSGLTAAASLDGNDVLLRLSGGVDETTYRLIVKMTCADGQDFTAHIDVLIANP